MTKKDYILLANTFKGERERIARDFPLIDDKNADTFAHANIELSIIIGKTAYALQSDNPKFDREKFLQACEP